MRKNTVLNQLEKLGMDLNKHKDATTDKEKEQIVFDTLMGISKIMTRLELLKPNERENRLTNNEDLLKRMMEII